MARDPSLAEQLRDQLGVAPLRRLLPGQSAIDGGFLVPEDIRSDLDTSCGGSSPRRSAAKSRQCG
jgi:hypothetical protein